METFDVTKAEETAKTDSADALRSLELIQKMEITNDIELSFAVDALAEVKTRHKEVDDKRKEFVQPLNKVVRGINAFFKPALNSLKSCETTLKGLVVEFQERQEAERDALIAEHKVEEAMEKLPTKVEGMSVRTVRNVAVTDKKAAVEWCLKNNRLDLVMLDVASMLDLDVPGTEIHETKNVAISTAKVKR